MSNDAMTQLRDLLKNSQANLKKCESSYKGLKAFRDSPQGLAFCAFELLQNAAAVRDCAAQLAEVAADVHTMYGAMTQPEETLDNDISLDEQRRRNGVVA